MVGCLCPFKVGFPQASVDILRPAPTPISVSLSSDELSGRVTYMSWSLQGQAVY